MPDFDAAAPTFERYRSFPPGVPEAIREGVWNAAGASHDARVLDLGAGTGRIGRAFQAAGDFYVGLDSSLEMLREVHQRQTEAPPGTRRWGQPAISRRYLRPRNANAG